MGFEVTTNNWPKQSGRNAFYGNPALPSGKLDPKWEAANIVRVTIPWRAVLAWDTDAVVKTIRIHRLCAPSLQRILDAIWAAAGKKQATIEAWGMHLYGGAFEFRLQRGGSTLSSHSWACAIDWDPSRNALGDNTPNFANVPAVLKAFADEGWTWGGAWARKDGMHWQAASI